MKLLFVHDRSERSVRALNAVVTAIAKAQSEGMLVEVERVHATTATDAPDVPLPSVFVDGVRAASPSTSEIYNAIARAHRRRPDTAQVPTVPVARVR